MMHVEDMSMMEPHYTVEQLSKEWNVSTSYVYRLFRDEDGVMRLAAANSRKRTRVSIRIPHSTAQRVYKCLTSPV